MTSQALNRPVDVTKLEAEQEFLRDWLQFIAYPAGQICCGNYQIGRDHMGQQEQVCCGRPDMDETTLDDVRQAMDNRLRQIDAVLAGIGSQP